MNKQNRNDERQSNKSDSDFSLLTIYSPKILWILFLSSLFISYLLFVDWRHLSETSYQLDWFPNYFFEAVVFGGKLIFWGSLFGLFLVTVWCLSWKIVNFISKGKPPRRFYEYTLYTIYITTLALIFYGFYLFCITVDINSDEQLLARFPSSITSYTLEHYSSYKYWLDAFFSIDSSGRYMWPGVICFYSGSLLVFSIFSKLCSMYAASHNSNIDLVEETRDDSITSSYLDKDAYLKMSFPEKIDKLKQDGILTEDDLIKINQNNKKN